MVCIPFDQQAAQWAEALPLERLIPRNGNAGMTITKHVHKHDFPFLPLLWFHVALTRKDKDIMASLSRPIQDVGGTAFFEMHLVDALVRASDNMDYMLEFSEERINFARKHMARYSAL